MNRGHHSSFLLAGIVLITALVWADECHAQAFTPSFDCKSDHGPDETAVCGNNELSRLDNEMATAYRNALSTASQDATAQLRSTQRDWLNKRKNCGASNACLKGLYERRLVELRVRAPGEPRPAPVASDVPHPVPLASDRPRPDSKTIEQAVELLTLSLSCPLPLDPGTDSAGMDENKYTGDARAFRLKEESESEQNVAYRGTTSRIHYRNDLWYEVFYKDVDKVELSDSGSADRTLIVVLCKKKNLWCVKKRWKLTSSRTDCETALAPRCSQDNTTQESQVGIQVCDANAAKNAITAIQVLIDANKE
jgi:uncharacterized protein